MSGKRTVVKPGKPTCGVIMRQFKEDYLSLAQIQYDLSEEDGLQCFRDLLDALEDMARKFTEPEILTARRYYKIDQIIREHPLTAIA